ncbi:MAG: acylphosphatase [Chloroflexi bacterium]|nr:acylphosphatase [Chloroflexota bacterium]MBI3340212.1 acylphosphatase [Chloroflexota bacterium]
MSESNEIIRVHVWVVGRVQNVGFRAHVEYHAREIGGVTGWVRNVGYDVVEIVAEGERSFVERFIGLVKQGPRGARVDESRLEEETPTGEFAAFEVRRSL